MLVDSCIDDVVLELAKRIMNIKIIIFGETGNCIILFKNGA